MNSSISTATLVAILFAAVLHASWNALGKAIPDRIASAALIGVAYTVVGACAVPFLALPHAGAWPFIAGSVIVQTGYLLLLMTTYRFGDFGQTYPISRGLSPLLVSVVSIGFLGERTSTLHLLGIAVVCAGLASMVFSSGVPKRGQGYGFAAATGVTIAAYTLIDGLGVRHSHAAISYAMWLFLLQGPIIPLIGWWRRRRGFLPSLEPYWRIGLLGGALSVVSYAIVVWAQNRAPLASVATLRETSVVFAALLGRLLFREPFGAVRIGAACAVAAGIVAIAVT